MQRFRVIACLSFALFSCAAGFAQNSSPLDGQSLKYITINDTELAYTEQGKGEPVILVHGGLGDYRTWAAQMTPFSKHFRVIAYSRRYHFPNHWVGDASDYSLKLHVKDLIAFILTLGRGPVHLVGHSYGGAVAAIAAAEHPELIRSLVLIEPRLLQLLPKTLETDTYHAERRELTQKVIGLLRAGDEKQAVKSFLTFTRGAVGEEKISASVLEVMEDNVHTLRPMLAAVEPPNTFVCEDAQRIRVPVLLVRGELSPKIYAPLMSQLQKCLQKSEQVTIIGSSHGVMQENPQDFNGTVLKFLRRHK
jgi:pimeloyl-ACP methyl ester carboxylesterase